MKIPIINQLSLYNYRYIIGYSVFGILLALLLLLNIGDLPRGLSTQEMESATKSATASIANILFVDPINAPYTLLQKISLHFFGITPFAIKLPSVILAITTGLALILMLRQWFRDNVAVLTSIIVVTAGPFVTMGRTGTALILYAFWLSIILLAATRKLYGTSGTFKWKLLFFAAAAASLYTPLMIYPLIAITVAGLMHPHIRHVIRKMSSLRLTIVITIAAIILAPLVWSLIQNPAHISTLLGIPETALSLETTTRNISIFGIVMFGFDNIIITTVMIPLFSAATIGIVGLGVLRTLRDHHSARSYMLIIWTILALMIVLLNPSALTILYMPIVLFIAVGIETLIREWYRLFPRNPYARIAALIPLTILLVSISTSSIARYFYGYMYAPDPRAFHQELTAIRHQLDSPALQGKQVALITTPETVAFYDLLRRDYDNVIVSDKNLVAPHKIVLEEKYASLDSADKTAQPEPYRLVTSGKVDDALLLRVYVSQE